MSIYKFIADYKKQKANRWHTPGHKGVLNSFDITELVCDEKLQKLLENAQKRVAQFYSAKEARLLTNGSSIGLKAAILAIEGDILSFSGRHQAVDEAATLAKMKVFEVERRAFEATVDDIKLVLNSNKTIKAIVIESPDYYGRVIQKEVMDYIKNSGLVFICDAAHGAHFAAYDVLKKECLASVADIINLSSHKTLNAYTQTAYLCINDLSLVSNVDTALKNLGTTSPNYIFLAQLEQAIIDAKNNSDKYRWLYESSQSFKEDIPCIKNKDFTRLVVDAKKLGFTGEELTRKLIYQKIYPEKFDDNFVIFIATPNDTKQKFDRLKKIILLLKLKQKNEFNNG